MNIQTDFSLKNYNTFGVDAKANTYVDIVTIEDLKTVLKSETSKSFFILGGGSNLLLTKDIDAMVLHLNLKGISITYETDDYAIVKGNAGENWHEFVVWFLNKNLGGVENMSLIPGNIGTAPIQNIGAYGIELKDVFHSCETINISTQEKKTFSNEDCNFGYRESVFKGKHKGKYIILSVTFKLKVDGEVDIKYGAIGQQLKAKDISDPSAKDVSDAVITIRKSKLPDPSLIGNSGSFFKNPIILKPHFNRLKKSYPALPSYPVDDFKVKVPAAWLIENAGWKGKTMGAYGVHKKQALVLVNYGNATGQEIVNVSIEIQETIFLKFGIHIEAEVNII